MRLFYHSVFYRRREFEYVRVPDNWFYRYRLHSGSIAKVALEGSKVVGSLGVISRICRIDGKKLKVGCFVDNCVLPTHSEDYEDILGNLLREMEKDLKEHKVAALYGWDYLKHFDEHRKFFEEMEFEWMGGVNWFPGGSTLSGEHPYKWEIKLSPYWRVGFRLLGYLHRIREISVDKLPKDIEIRKFNVKSSTEIKGAIRLIERCYADSEFAPSYTYSSFKNAVDSNKIHGFIAEKGGRGLEFLRISLFLGAVGCLENRYMIRDGKLLLHLLQMNLQFFLNTRIAVCQTI